MGALDAAPLRTMLMADGAGSSICVFTVSAGPAIACGHLPRMNDLSIVKFDAIAEGIAGASGVSLQF
jgi:hypothetical protein